MTATPATPATPAAPPPPARHAAEGSIGFSHLMAYPYSLLEPAREDAARDDGEPLIARFRPLWASLDPSEASDSGSRVAHALLGSSAVDEHQPSAARDLLCSSLMQPHAAFAPQAYLVAPSTLLLAAEVMDKHQSDAQRRNLMVAVRGRAEAALRGLPPSAREPPVAVFRFKQATFQPLLKAGASVQSDAMIEVRAGDEACEIKISITSFTGSRKILSVLAERDAASKLAPSRLFDTVHLASTALATRRADLLPTLPTQLPFRMQLRVAEFWRDRMRAQSLVAACQPSTNLSKRPLCFDSVQLVCAEADQSLKRVVLRGTLHATSSTCLCAAHGLPPTLAQRSLSSKTTMSIAMCGQRLRKFSSDMEFGECPQHRGQTPRVRGIDDVCCHNTTCEVGCAHAVGRGEYKPGVSLRGIAIDGHALRHAQLLVAHALRARDALAPVLGKRERDDVAAECEVQCQRLDKSVRKLPRVTEDLPEQELEKRDAHATACLRDGSLKRVWKKSERRAVLVKPNKKTGGLSAPKSLDLELAALHEWMFPKIQKK